ncbi:MAG: erythromycin esterase family protein [Firmicutes bacterium]|nr:erythromycin esterase family protein [Bacillota bacterium]
MKNKSEKKHTLRRLLLALLAILIIAFGIFSHFGGFGTGACADTEEFARYAGQIEDIALPAATRVVALGEATHGNAEFQQLKLDVFRVLAEKYGVRALALEGDYGSCEAANRYIQGGEGTPEEAAAAIGFAIYRTEQMEQLLAWMREYNETAADEDKLRFYGFDMQRYEYDYRYLLEAAEALGLDTAALSGLWDDETDGFSAAFDTEQRAAVITDVKNALLRIDDPTAVQAVHFADVLLQNCELGKVNSSSDGQALRDRFMAENVLWIMEQEQALGRSCVFVSAHNGHIEQNGTYGPDDKVMGTLLADELGDGYFAIGTDFYKTRCNLAQGRSGKRSVHTFYSHDPLAKAAKACGYDVSWLDFAAIPEASALKPQTEDYTWMGSLGDAYSPLMAVFPMAYRVWRAPAQIYDGMIFVTNAHPTAIRELPAR